MGVRDDEGVCDAFESILNYSFDTARRAASGKEEDTDA